MESNQGFEHCSVEFFPSNALVVLPMFCFYKAIVWKSNHYSPKANFHQKQDPNCLLTRPSCLAEYFWSGLHMSHVLRTYDQTLRKLIFMCKDAIRYDLHDSPQTMQDFLPPSIKSLWSIHKNFYCQSRMKKDKKASFLVQISGWVLPNFHVLAKKTTNQNWVMQQTQQISRVLHRQFGHRRAKLQLGASQP